MAVGTTAVGGNYRALIEEWNGTGWSMVTSVNPSNTLNFLSGVSCVGTAFCMADGYYNNLNSIEQILIEQWNGSNWSLVTSPISSTEPNDLSAVSCTSTSFCMASGFYRSSSVGYSLFGEWNGTGWSVVSSPDVKSPDLNTISCSSTSFCVAAGGYNKGSAEQTLIEEWNGTNWNEVDSPSIGGTDNNLDAVSCADATFCMAVTYYTNASGDDQTLTENWDGASWRVVSSPDVSGAELNLLLGVSCGSGSFCMAAGYYQQTAVLNDQTLMEGWGVTSATFQDSPSVSYDGWNGIVDSAANGGTYRASLVKGATASFKFHGTGITWIAHEGPKQGIASVTIDGVKKGNLDLYATSQQSYTKAYSGLTSKSHTIVITVTGTKNAAASGTSVAVDAFVVGGIATQNSSPSVTYDSWTGATSTSASGGSVHLRQRTPTPASASRAQVSAGSLRPAPLTGWRA